MKAKAIEMRPTLIGVRTLSNRAAAKATIEMTGRLMGAESITFGRFLKHP
jgi:hypothetical protein